MLALNPSPSCQPKMSAKTPNLLVIDLLVLLVTCLLPVELLLLAHLVIDLLVPREKAQCLVPLARCLPLVLLVRCPLALPVIVLLDPLVKALCLAPLVNNVLLAPPSKHCTKQSLVDAPK